MGTAKAVSAVCVVHEVMDGYYHPTAIDKRPVAGPVRVGELGPEGDRHFDSHHGGVDAAVYVYADEDAAYVAGMLDRDVPPGFLGENLRTHGLDVTGALLGERWWIGEPGTGVLLEVRRPRTPCRNLAMRVGEDDFHIRFNATGRVGAMCRVLQTGVVAAGDPVTIEHRPDHDVSVSVLVTGMNPAQARGLLDSGASLTTAVRAKARRYANGKA
ncbi:MAG: MOSC domain-containing protein [Nocardioides sp.]|nr:MOSC domain-containing protein [Nocardioides sp.]